MLTIRQAQMEATLTQDEPKLIDFVVAHAKRACRDSVRDIDPASLREMVTNGIARAHGHGLLRAREVAAFVGIMFEIGPNFDEQPDIRRALADQTVPHDRRFDTMLERVPDSAWKQAEQNKLSAAWFPELLAGGTDVS
jgi:hypothetical protein